MSAAFTRHLEAVDKAASIRAGLDVGAVGRVDIDPHVFREVPTSPFAYWVSQRVRRMFDPANQFEQDGRVAGVGLQTSDDFRFVRTWFEVLPTRGRWSPIAKGGPRSTFYRDLGACVLWADDGREVKAYAETTPGTTHWSRKITNTDYYGRPGLTWPLRGKKFSAQAVPAGSVFSIAGKMAFVPESDDRLYYLAVLNSMAFDALMGLFAGKVGGVQYEAGLIRRTPVPQKVQDHRPLTALARRGWSGRHRLDTAVEVSHAFVLPAALQTMGETLAERVDSWRARVVATEAELKAVEADIDEQCFDLYGFSSDDRNDISAGLAAAPGDEPELEDGGEAGAIGSDPSDMGAELVSWAVGVAVGRFDVRLATGERARPSEPDPFARLPLCSPGMLSDAEGRPATASPPGYAIETSPVLVTDPGHPLDIASAVAAVFDLVFGADADRWWADVGTVLGGRSGDLARWLGKGFYGFHLRIYSRSRRKAPILWPIGTRSGSYIVWLYAQRVTDDSLLRVLHDVIAPKIALEERRMSELREEAGPSPTAVQRRAIAALDQFVEELRELAEAVESLSPFWAPNLDDGVVVALAPFSRLFAHHGAWSRELLGRWGRLVAGDYDWAHLAMRLWPERVVPKCVEDRSLAIAHNLEETLWTRDATDPEKWSRRCVPVTLVDELVDQRRNPAVGAALSRL